MKALEYGATLDPVTLLAPAMMRRAKDGIRSVLVSRKSDSGRNSPKYALARCRIAGGTLVG